MQRVTVEEIKARIDCVVWIGGKVRLKKKGAYYEGLCCFHEEKKPSFAVFPGDGGYHCYSCGAHGDIIDFVREYERVNFKRAIEILSGAQYDTSPPVLIPRVERAMNCEGVWRHMHEQVKIESLRVHAKQLGVSALSLTYLDIGWSGNAWAFPFRDEKMNVIGVRFRAADGSKWSFGGGKSGLFIPRIPPHKVAYISEGPTDAAALLTMGFYAIGRAACLGQEQMLNKFLKRSKVERVVIVSDNDKPSKRRNGAEFYPGREGAEKLQSVLTIPSTIWQPPVKDVRQFLIQGGKREDLPQ